ncbi:hypothetical protein [Klebsiella sp. BIGb0407]|uniref:hypothetical protein n=1 Tax=Klebsiella sp. BIGb0407 TaxID=2940603 RepID=UPI00216A878E|nr:hypothetical protein [Klebsiella sp. BIGb0407]MCS3434325.1 hypothetical protein [Klebsiella sp. BIGb0407]
MSRVQLQRRNAAGETALPLTSRRRYFRRDAMSAGHGATKRRIRKNAASGKRKGWKPEGSGMRQALAQCAA